MPLSVFTMHLLKARTFTNLNKYLFLIVYVKYSKTHKVNEKLTQSFSLIDILSGHGEPIAIGLLVGAKKYREAQGSYFV